MMHLATKITKNFIKKGIIDTDSADWFQYGLEKRISTVLTSVIFFLIATKISGFLVSFAYLGSFCESEVMGTMQRHILAVF